MKKFLTVIILILLLLSIIIWLNLPKITPYYTQLTKTRIGLNFDLQPESQKDAHFVGSKKCQECHEENYHDWKSSMHAKMIQEIKTDDSAVVADFSKLPEDADFTLAQAVYTIGSKFKQRYMIPAQINGKEDFRLGNYQWNSQNKKWQSFKPYKYWYKDAYPHDNKSFPTSTTCDGCHFTGYMSTGKREELSISCESCHGPGSNHVKDPKNAIFKASLSDPMRTNEVCFQCHMRNRDKRMETQDATGKDLWMDAKDYPDGYEPGKPLINYKLPAPFSPGEETKEFWANGAAKKPEGNDACMKCHAFGSIIGPHQDRLEDHTQHKADSKGSLCIECHMPKTAKHTGKSPLTVRSHLFTFTYPAQTKAYGMPPETNACYACHKDKTLKSLQDDLKNWGKLEWEKLELSNTSF